MIKLFRRSPATASPALRNPLGWLLGLLGQRDIERRVLDNIPSWQEYSEQKLHAAEERRHGALDLPPHRVFVSSPLQWNFLYVLIVGAVLGLAYAKPAGASYLVYGAILSVFALGLLATFRDGVFFHMEGRRLEQDGDMINRRSSMSAEQLKESEQRAEQKGHGLLKSLRKAKQTIFRSKLMQIHYQNILRTFEAGARRTWVYQDASISDIQTLLSQRGMKLAWTVIEVLPQLGLLGTLVGLLQMFQAFRASAEAPQLSILAGFGTALGTTLLANLFVLVLRPLHMRNERCMNEILTTLQMLMAMFILPTQHYVLDRERLAQDTQGTPAYPTYPAAAVNGSRRLSEAMDRMSQSLADFVEVQRSVDSGALAQQSAGIVEELHHSLQAVRQTFDPRQLASQHQAIGQLTQAVQQLGTRLEAAGTMGAAGAAPASEKMERDLLQVRLLTRDTLLLLEKLSSQMEHLPALAQTGAGTAQGEEADTPESVLDAPEVQRDPELLTAQPRIRSLAFDEPQEEAPLRTARNAREALTVVADPPRIRKLKERQRP